MEMVTTKERYDAEMKNIHQANAKANGQSDDVELEKIADDAERVLDKMKSRKVDKSMGDVKEPASGAFSSSVKHQQKIMTKDQFLKWKEAKAAQKAIHAVQQQQRTKAHLSHQDNNIISELLKQYEKNELKDPILMAYLDEKIELAKKYIEATVAIKELQKKLLNDVATNTNNVVKCRGAIEQVDRMLLKQYRRLKLTKKE